MKSLILVWGSLVAAASQKVAIIGGGISGTFAAKYLADYDTDCTIESITIFEPMPMQGPMAVSHSPDNKWQGSRVQSVLLDDGSIVELGASIGFREFHLVLEMIQSDPELEMGPHFNTGSKELDSGLRKGMGIYDGDGQWNLLTTSTASFLTKVLLVWRYGWDLLRVSRICKEMMKGFAELPILLSSDLADTFYNSPDEIWKAIGLYKAVHSSFDQLLDSIGVKVDLPGWRKWLFYQGSIRKELLTAINLVNYNQDNSQVNGIVGLGSFAASSGGLFSIIGGNSKLISSALKQAARATENHCNATRVQQVPTTVTTVVGKVEGLDIFSDTTDLGTFDIIILAAPLHQARINFLVQSHFDRAVLNPMPLGRLVNPEETDTEDGHPLLHHGLLDAATRPYTQVVTTVVSNSSLDGSVFAIPDSSLPRSIIMTAPGKRNLHNITAISQLKSSGLYKVFSNDKLSIDTLTKLFGPHHVVEYVKLWGGAHGGATPDYQGKGSAPEFLLYDGALGLEGHTSSGALYYPIAMEQSSLACMELAAVGARAVAKLVARRLGLIRPTQLEEAKDEL